MILTQTDNCWSVHAHTHTQQKKEEGAQEEKRIGGEVTTGYENKDLSSVYNQKKEKSERREEKMTSSCPSVV